MKKFLLFMFFLSLLLISCANNKDKGIENIPDSNPSLEGESKTLIVYFTWSSNTETMAKFIKENTNSDLYEIIPAVPYPTEYTPCTEVALQERDTNARPQIKDSLSAEKINSYTSIFIGYPIWWHTAPMIIGTFLESYDLTDVHIYPFAQSASMNTEQFNQSMEFVKSCAKNAIVHDGLFARASDTASIQTYLETNGFIM